MSSSSVLVISEDTLTTALLLSLLELEGFRALAIDSEETVPEAVARVKANLALVDCDHAVAATAAFREAARAAGTKVIIFSPERMRAGLEAAAKREGYPWLTLPISRAELGALIRRTLVG